MNLSECLKQNTRQIVLEGIRIKDLPRAVQLIKSYLQKRNIYTAKASIPVYYGDTSYLLTWSFVDKGQGCAWLWDADMDRKSLAPAHVLFSNDINKTISSLAGDDFDTASFEFGIATNGASVPTVLKLVENVLTGKIKMSASDVEKAIKDAKVFECSAEDLDDLEFLITEEKDERQKRMQTLRNQIRYRKNKGEDASDLEKELEKLKITKSPKVKAEPDPELDTIQDEFEELERATPEERFEDMEYYITSVINGVRPLALLCGAPGVGKTFRVMQNIKSRGLEQNIDYALQKGKCTATALYKKLHDFKEPNQLLIFDDCDSIFKDDDAINLIKAAYDSSDERWVSWGTAHPIPMSEEQANACDDAEFDVSKGRWFYPKEFQYQGGGIIITNFNAGQIDTAIRNRALICDLDFTVDEILSLIEGLAPKIKPGELSKESKDKAIEYLRELANKKAPVELSIRSFTLCAGIFDSGAPEKTVMRMIREQMRLQAARGGRKY